MKKRVLVTGASGAVATEFIKNIQKNPEYEIWAATSHPSECGIKAQEAHIISNDMLDGCLSSNIFDCLVCCAFPRNVGEKQWASGLEFGFNVLFLAHKYDVKKVVHISSQSIYGWDRTVPAREGDTVSLNNPYGTGKYCTEQLVNHLFAGSPHTNIRLATIIGNHTEERVPNKFMHRLIAGGDLKIQDGNQIFSFLDIRDAGEALYALVDSDNCDWKELYNIGTEEYYTLSEIADKCLSIVKHFGNSSSKIDTISVNIILNNRLDCKSFYGDFGWKAKYSLEDTLLRLYSYYSVLGIDF